MPNTPDTQATDGIPTYLGGGDPAGRFADYYPAWVDKLAGDVTLEGSLLDGAVQGADAVRAVIVGVRQLYDRQDFNFAGPWGDNSFIEDYTAEVHRRPVGCVHLVTFNAHGQAQHIAANYRPLSSVVFFSRLLRERNHVSGAAAFQANTGRPAPSPRGAQAHRCSLDLDLPRRALQPKRRSAPANAACDSSSARSSCARHATRS